MSNTNRDPNEPVKFAFPDGDSVALIPWGFVVDKLTPFINSLVPEIQATNADIQRINNRVQYWLDKQEEDGV